MPCYVILLSGFIAFFPLCVIFSLQYPYINNLKSVTKYFFSLVLTKTIVQELVKISRLYKRKAVSIKILKLNFPHLGFY